MPCGAAFGEYEAAGFTPETEAQAECWASPDSAEGIRAFVEKRKPAFGAGEAAEAPTARAGARFE